MAKVCPLFSGSSGNSYYIGTGEHGILVDAGRTAKQMEGALSANDINISSVRAIFVTHEHTDHVKGLRVLASRHHIKVYSSMGTLEALNDMQILSGKFPCDVISENGIQEAGMEIRPFHTSHDSAESVGYRISLPNGRVVVVATDLGFVSEAVGSCRLRRGGDGIQSRCWNAAKRRLSLLFETPYPVASRAFVQQRLRPGASGLGKAGNYPDSFGAFKQRE